MKIKIDLSRLTGMCLLMALGHSTGLSQNKSTDELTIDQLTNSVRGILQRRAFKSQDADETERLLKADPSLLKSKAADGATLLHWAAGEGDRGKVAQLLALGMEVDAKDNRKLTPLHWSASSGHASTVELLMSHHADVDARDVHGQTSLQYAALLGRREIAELLVAHRANPATADNRGFSPFLTATDRGHLEMVEFFLKHGAKVNERSADDWRSTPLHLAAQAEFTSADRYREVAQFLLAHGAEVNGTNAMGETPLHRAARLGHAAVAEVLLGSRANVEAKDKEGLTPLHWAASIGHLEIARALLAFKAGVNTPSADGSTPLHYAVGKGFKALVELLLANKANTDAVTARGDTPIMLALAMRHTEVAELLQKHSQSSQAQQRSPGSRVESTVESRVGKLGDPDRLVFAGLKTFTPQAIRSALMQNVDFLLAAHPVAPRSEYLSILPLMIRSGYEASGFPNAQVSAALDAAQEKIILTIAEGPCYLKGGIDVFGSRTISVPGLVRRLTEAYPPTQMASSQAQIPPAANAAKDAITTSFQVSDRIGTLPGNEKRLDKTGKEVQPTPAVWVKGDPASFSIQALAGFNWAVTNSLADSGHLFPKIEIHVLPDAVAGTASLRIEILDEGPRDAIHEIEIKGNKRNSRDDILKYLSLAPGTPVDGELISRTELLLWRSARFLRHDVSVRRQESDPTKLKLTIDLVEYSKAPPLTDEPSAEEQALLRMCDWLSAFSQRDEDLEVSLGKMPWDVFQKTQVDVIMAPRTGWFIRFRNPESNGTSAGLLAVSVTSKALTWFSPQRGLKLSMPMTKGQVFAFLKITANPLPDPDARFDIEIGAAVRSDSAMTNGAATIETLFAPVAFLDQVHRTNVTATWKGGLLVVTNEDSLLEMDVATGRPLKLDLFDDRKQVGFARIEKGLFAAATNDMAASGTKLVEAFDSSRTVSSTIAFAVDELLRGALLAPWLAHESTSEQVNRAAVALHKVFQGGILAPLDEFSASGIGKEDKEFSIPVSPTESPQQATSAMMAGMAAWVFRQCDQLFPKQSWPWTAAHEAVLVLSGKGKYADLELSRLYGSKEIGPIGYLTLAKLLAMVNSPAARAFAQRGLTFLFVDDFRNDYRLLFEGNSPLSQSMQKVVAAIRTLSDEDVEAIAFVLPKGFGDFVRDAGRLLRRSEGQSDREIIALAMDRYWEQSLRSQVRAALMTVLQPPSAKRTARSNAL